MPKARSGVSEASQIRTANKKNAPDIYTYAPKPPATLTTNDEKRMWSRTARVLVARGTLAKTDKDMLEAYVIASVTYHKARLSIREQGDKSPFAKIFPAISREFREYSAALGLGTLQRGNPKIPAANSRTLKSSGDPTPDLAPIEEVYAGKI